MSTMHAWHVPFMHKSKIQYLYPHSISVEGNKKLMIVVSSRKGNQLTGAGGMKTYFLTHTLIPFEFCTIGVDYL